MATDGQPCHPDSRRRPAQARHRRPPCNGCGLCCAAGPCLLGIAASLPRTGACKALRWDAEQSRYHCGMLTKAARFGALPARLVARWISAGAGCDAQLASTDGWR